RAVEFVARHDMEFRNKVKQPPVFPLPGNKEEAEDLAREARTIIGAQQEEALTNLGTTVIRAGLLPSVVDLGTDTAAAASLLLANCAVAVGTRALRAGCRRLSLPHELGHLLVPDEYTIDGRVDGSTSRDSREQLTDRFARSLLLPS